MLQSIMPTYQRMDIGFVSGEGAWLMAQTGQRYLDAVSGIAVCSLGHAHPEIADVIAEQSSRLIHTSNLYRIPLQEQLADRLTELSALDRVFFCNSGAEANEAAIKACRKYAHHKGNSEPVIVVMGGGFHGRTLSTLSATGNPKAQAGFSPLLPGFHPIPYDDVDPLGELASSELKDNIVAVMLEPIQGEGGVVIPAPGYLTSVRALCDENGWLLVLDEIQTGLCRTGAWFACQHENVAPDIMTLAKSLGNGLPVGACLATEEVAGLMGPGSHGSTFGGNPLVCAVALTVIEIMTREGLADHAAELGREMLAILKSELQHLDGIVDIRGKGLMLGIELSVPCTELIGKALQAKLLINVTAEKVVRLLPPLIISRDEMQQIARRVCALIKDHLG